MFSLHTHTFMHTLIHHTHTVSGWKSPFLRFPTDFVKMFLFIDCGLLSKPRLGSFHSFTYVSDHYWVVLIYCLQYFEAAYAVFTCKGTTLRSQASEPNVWRPATLQKMQYLLSFSPSIVLKITTRIIFT